MLKIMKIQYAKFISLVLDKRHGAIPIFPFSGDGGLKIFSNIEFHYSPDVKVVEFGGNLGNVISHYRDEHSYNIVCFSCSDEFYENNPDILVDVVEMGLAPFGGKVLTPEQALEISKKLQPLRKVKIMDRRDTLSTFYPTTITYGELYLDENNLLTRDITKDETE